MPNIWVIFFVFLLGFWGSRVEALSCSELLTIHKKISTTVRKGLVDEAQLQLDILDIIPVGFNSKTPTIILVPGLTKTQAEFVSLAKQISQTQGVRVLSLDLLNVGSGGFFKKPTPIEDAQLVVQLVFQRVSQESPYFFVGHSRGALVASIAARLLKEAGHVGPEKLLLLNPYLEWLDPLKDIAKMTEVNTALLLGGVFGNPFAFYFGSIARETTHSMLKFGQEPFVRAWVAHTLKKDSNKTPSKKDVDKIMEKLKGTENYELGPFLDNPNLPVVFVFAKGDGLITLSLAEKFKGKWQGPFEFINVDGSHYLPYENPSLIVDILAQSL